MKIALGTVQYGVPYGINNSDGIPNDEAVKDIFNVAFDNGIKILDTAIAYGNSEKRVAKLSDNKFKIVTKFPKVQSESELSASFQQSLSNLQTNSVYGYIAHHADTLIENPELWAALINAKENSKVEKIGYSLYTTEQCDKLLDLGLIPDLVQLPYSILDRKFENHLKILKNEGTEIHIRSVFLQGLYFMNIDMLPEKLKVLRSALSELQLLCIEYNVSVGALAINYVNENPYVDKVVIGVDTSLQLLSNLDMIREWKSSKELIQKVEEISVQNKEMLNPANW